MKVLVVYDSYFGNTEKVAREVAASFVPQNQVIIIKAADIKPGGLQGIDLLIVGTPTRGFSPSEATQGFLKTVTPGTFNGVRVAAFDTRIDMSGNKNAFLRFIGRFFRYAAGPTAAALEKAGGIRAQSPAGFIVEENEGPLRTGELERAVSWAKAISV